LRRRDSGEHVDPVEMAVQQQHLDEHPRARGITVGFAWIVPLMKAYPNKMVKYTHDWVYFDADTAEMVFCAGAMNSSPWPINVRFDRIL
jgi:hypothetical protein